MIARLAFLLVAAVPASIRGAELRAGVARVNLTEQLQARILVLRTANESVALVACELYRFQSQRVSEEARRTLGIGTVLFAASGVHSTPEDPPPGADEAILGGLRQASSTMFGARLGAGAGTAELAYNWRVVDPHGAVTMLWRNPGRVPTGPLWNTIPVWRIDNETGELRALLFSAASRASIVPRAGATSADYPGYASRRTEAMLDSRAVALFVQGASGNLPPVAHQTSVDQAMQAGEQLAREVVRVSRTIAPQTEQNPSLTVHRSSLSVRERWGAQRPVQVEAATIVVNRAFALAAIPGLPFVEHQIALADRSPAAHTMLATHTQTGNGEWAGVLPTIRAAAEGGYGASYGTRLEVGAGEAMLDAVLVNIYRALGKLDELPRGDLVRETPPEGRPRK